MMHLLRAWTRLFGIQTVNTSRVVRISFLISAHKITFNFAPFGRKNISIAVKIDFDLETTLPPNNKD